MKSWKYFCVQVFSSGMFSDSSQLSFHTPWTSTSLSLPTQSPTVSPFPHILVVYKVMGRGVNKMGRRGGWHWHQLHGRHVTFLFARLPDGHGKIIYSWRLKRRWSSITISITGASLANVTNEITFSLTLFLNSAAPNSC